MRKNGRMEEWKDGRGKNGRGKPSMSQAKL
jgi:hypothetical protein